jgi:hypothetical protein
MPHKDLPIRPLDKAFDPVGADTLGVPTLDFASLFREKTVTEDAPLTLYPEDLGVPWHTSLPWVRQSKFWAHAEASGRDLVNRISADKASERGTLPMELEDDRRKCKIDELVEDAISCCAYLYPTSSPTRLALLTQSVLLLFLHDGMSNYRGILEPMLTYARQTLLSVVLHKMLASKSQLSIVLD